jgi:5-amino-6-(5-phospho-D-ribitylamino)uracil phosphatase
MHRYYVTDLDGTLLRSDATVSPYTAEVLASAANSGAMIGYATARSWQSSRTIVSAIPWNCPVVLYNGAVLLDPRTRTVLSGRWLDRDVANALLMLGRSYGLVPLAFALDPYDSEKVYHERLTRAEDLAFKASRPNDPRFQELETLSMTDSDRTLILTYIGAFEALEPLAKAAERAYAGSVHIHFMQDRYLDAYFLEFSHPQANKRDGLQAWCRYVGCEPADVTVFGDQLNDIGMFETAGRRVAVSNADTRLIALADHIIGTNDEDGVARYIAGELRGERLEGRTSC